MTVLEYIKPIIDKLVAQFPALRIRCEDHFMSETLFIEVVPNNIYRKNEDYIAIEGKMKDAFHDVFPCYGISFISDDALVGLDEIDYEKVGLFYNQPEVISYSKFTIEKQFANPVSVNVTRGIINISFIPTMTKSGILMPFRTSEKSPLKAA